MASRPTGAQLRVTDPSAAAVVGMVVGMVVGAVVLLWLVALVWFRPWIAHNDFAVFRIALERELDGHIRLVGAHSRLDVFHPGPLREWVFAVPYWLSGRRAAALPAMSLALNAVWVIWIIALAHRLRPRAWGAVCAIGLLVLVIAVGPDLASPWNPHLAILPMYLACWSAVSVLGRRGEGSMACIVAASFAAQLHASVLLLGGALLAAAVVGLAVQRLWIQTAGAVGLAVLLWSGPIIDLRKGADANLVRLGTVGADGESVGLAVAMGHVSRLVWPGTPLGRVTVRPNVEVLPGFHRWWLVVVVIGLVAAMWWSLRRPAPGGPTTAGGAAEAPIPTCPEMPVRHARRPKRSTVGRSRWLRAVWRSACCWSPPSPCRCSSSLRTDTCTARCRRGRSSQCPWSWASRQQRSSRLHRGAFRTGWLEW